MFRFFKYLLMFAIGFSTNIASANKLVEASRANSSEKISEYSSFVIQTMLEDVGLTLADKTKKNKVDNKEEDTQPDNIIPKPKPPTPTPQPVPPEPKPEPKPEPNKSVKAKENRFSKIRKNFESRYDKILDRWNKRYQQTKAQWREANIEYKKEEEALASQVYDFSEVMESSNTVLSASENEISTQQILSSMAPGDFHIIPHALDFPIRNQSRRGTCAAFAGIRAIETLVVQNDKQKSLQVDLSEQHFYWLSKPKCSSTPCQIGKNSEGSIFDTGFLISQKNTHPSTAIIDEVSCPYVPNKNVENLTFTPLKGCRVKGKARIAEMDLHLTMEDVLPRLYHNQPIASGFRLTNSYKNAKGVVRLHDSVNKVKAKGEHVSGHAMLLVGYIKLPVSMHAKEGRYCTIMANSWGPGYGVGGYACLTEKWMDANRIALPKSPDKNIFTALKSVNWI